MNRDADEAEALQSIGKLYPGTFLHSRKARKVSEMPGGQEYLTTLERRSHTTSLAKDIKDRRKVGKMRQFEVWLLEYYENSYLADCSAEEFKEVWQWVNSNNITIDPNHMIRPEMESYNGQTAYWMRRFTHLLAESQFRGGIPAWEYTDEGQTEHERLLRPIINIPLEHWNRHWIFKFGKEKHILEARENETIRFAPAASYADPSLNSAQFDIEGTASWKFPGSTAPTGTIRTEDGREIPLAIGNVTITKKNELPFFVWCAAGQYRPEIANAFDAEAVLVIRDRKKFTRVLDNAIMKAGFGLGLISDVHYFDPFEPPTRDIPTQFLKHHKYMYQKEVRTACALHLTIDVSEPFHLSLPGLKKYSHVALLRPK